MTGFPILRRIANGEDVTPILKPFKALDYNLFRGFDYVTWAGTGWDSPTPQDTLDAVRYLDSQGFMTELTLLTDDDPARIGPAIRLVEFLAGQNVRTLLPEIGNEPITNKNIDTRRLKDVLDRTGWTYSSGHYENYEDPRQWYGRYGQVHTERGPEWMRKGKELREWYDGWDRWEEGGAGSGVWHASFEGRKIAWVADEPIGAAVNADPGRRANQPDRFHAYFAIASLAGAGATFHYQNGLHGRPPDDTEYRCARAASDGLHAFPEDAPLSGGIRHGDVEKNDEKEMNSLRTYRVGPYGVRIPPPNGELRGSIIEGR